MLSGSNGLENKHADVGILPILQKCLHVQSSFSGSLRKAGALFKNDTVSVTLLLQLSEEPEPKVTENENDTIISMFTKFYMITKP